MTINIFVFKGDLNGEIRSGAFLFLLGIFQTRYLDCSYSPEIIRNAYCSRYGNYKTTGI